MKALAGPVPGFVSRRAWWLLPLILWAMTVAVSLFTQFAEQRQHVLEVATEGARDMFQMVVLMRAWNAGHGGVYVPVTEQTQPNPYLEHPRRDLITRDGQRLTMINPAFMTRQISEQATKNEGVRFHITSLRPIRPMNAADAWESEALHAFEQGAKERMELIQDARSGTRLRYMAPLKVAPPCMTCHARQGYQVGDIRGGISVTLPYAPFEMYTRPARIQILASHALVFVLVAALGWLLLELLRAKWLDLARHIAALDSARASLEANAVSLEAARDQAETANRAKGALLANVSHELRTPMNGILGMAELLRSTRLDATQSEYLATLQTSGMHLMKLLGSIIDFARIDESATSEETLQPFPPGRIVASVAAMHAAHASAKGIELRVEKGERAESLVLGDAERLRGILDRLVDNAIKFTEKGHVTLGIEVETIYDQRRKLTYRVTDTGQGITPEMQARLFQPFEIADATIRRHHGGLGLGLALCKKLADGMGATLSVRSKPGEGSTFTLTVILRGAPATNRPLTDSGIATFIELLMQHDIRASKLFADLSDDLRARLGPDYEQLEQCMNAYRYPEARELLRIHSDLI